MELDLSTLKPEDIPIELIQNHPFVQELTDNIIYNKDLEKEVTLPYVKKDVILMSPGTWNGFTYTAKSIEMGFNSTDWKDSDNKALYLDHLDRSARDWIGEVFNVRLKGDTVIGDLRIVSDKPTAMALAYGAHLGISPKVEGDADETTQKMNHFVFRNFSVVKHPAIKTAYINSAKAKTSNALTQEEPIILPLEVKKLADEEIKKEEPVVEDPEEKKPEEVAPAEETTPEETPEIPAEEALAQKSFDLSEEVIAKLAERLAPMIAKILAAPKEEEKPKEEEPVNPFEKKMADTFEKVASSISALSEKVEKLSEKKVAIENSEKKLAEPVRVSQKAPSPTVVKELSQEQKDTAFYNMIAVNQGNPEKVKRMEGC